MPRISSCLVLCSKRWPARLMTSTDIQWQRWPWMLLKGGFQILLRFHISYPNILSNFKFLKPILFLKAFWWRKIRKLWKDPNMRSAALRYCVQIHTSLMSTLTERSFYQNLFATNMPTTGRIKMPSFGRELLIGRVLKVRFGLSAIKIYSECIR